MAVRERVALLFLIVVIFFVIKCSHGLPNNYTHRPTLGDKKHVNFNSTTFPRTKPMVKPNSRNRISFIKNNESLYEKFNFPEMQYPMASTPNTPLYFHEFGKNSKNPQIYTPGGISKKRRNTKLRSKTPLKIAENFKGAEFSSAPSYRDVGLLPDVEYPVNTKDIWQPNYWNCPQKMFTSSPMNSSKTSTIHSTKGSLKTKMKAKPSIISKSKRSKPPVSQKENPIHVKHTKKVINSNQPVSVRRDPVQSDLPKKRSHDISKLISEDSDYFDNFYAATPMPYLSQKEDKTKSTLRSRIISNLAQKAVSLIKNIVHSEKNNSTTENYNFASINEDDMLEEILCLPPSNFNDYSLVKSDTFYATTPRTSLDYSYSTTSPYNVTQPWINLFTAFTEQPEQYNNSQESDISVSKNNTTNVIENNSYINQHKIDNTILSNINEIINTETDTTTLSPRGCVYDDNKLIIDRNTSILWNHSDVSTLDKANIISYNDTESKITQNVKGDKTAYNIIDSSFKQDDDYTTDVYPELSENGFVFSTASPLHMSDDPSWSNAEIIDPYKSLSYPDELEEYYMTLT